MINGHEHPYVRAAIDGEMANLAAAVEGTRNQTLFKTAANLAGFGMKEGELLHYLKPVAEQIGLRGSEFYRTVKSGVKAGHANPRKIPDIPLNRTPPPDSTDQKSKLNVDAVATSEGPSRLKDEVRRHAYRVDGRPVRIKIKRSSGAYSNWYRVQDEAGVSWQPSKPAWFTPCPYFRDANPFAEGNGVIYWPEGEKDCDYLDEVGLPAFTFGGTGDGLPDGIVDFLRGREIVILADNDPGGRSHAERKAELAHSVANTVRIVEFAELPPKGDVSDFLQSASVSDLERRVNEAPVWMPSNIARSAGWRSAVIAASDLKTTQFSPIKYVLPGYISEGVTIFAGKPKIGKSWLLYDVCLACTADRFVLGDIKPVQGDVLYLALEDSRRRLKKRLQKLLPFGEWPRRLTLTTEWRKADEGGIKDIEEWCDSASAPVLIVIDTLERFRPAAKSHTAAYSNDYVAISELARVAHKRGIAIVVIHHVRKMEADDPFDTVSGTNGLTGAADTVLVLKRQAGNVTLHARGRDIEEKETACQFSKDTCRWTLLGEATAVHTSSERAAVIEALRIADSEGLHIMELMAATGRTDRNALDQLLYKMLRDGALVRVKRGVYALPQ